MTGGHVADDDLQRHNLDLLDEGVAVIDLLHVVGGDALLLELLHQSVGQLVVDNALVADGALLLAVTGRGIVLVVHHNDFGVIGGKNLLCLAFVQLLFDFVIHDKRSLFLIYCVWLTCKYYRAATSAAMAASFLAMAAAVSARKASSLAANASSATARIATAR